MNKSKKILIVLTRPPYPFVDGTRERLFKKIETLTLTNNLIDVLIISNERVTIKQKEAILKLKINNLKIFKIPFYRILLNIFLGFFSNKPIQSKFFFHKSALNHLVKFSNNYDIIFFHTLRCGEYIEYLKKFNTRSKILLGFNDAISMNYSKASKLANGLWKLIYKIELNRLINYELKLINLADKLSIISQKDLNYLQQNWIKKYPEIIMKNFTIIRNAIDDNILKYNYKPENSNLVFMGNLHYPPNRNGLNLFYKTIWPFVKKAFPNIKFLIIGKGGNKYFNKYSDLAVLDFVEYPYHLITKQALFISPANFGAGVPTKTLTAMAMGMPVISTEENAKSIEGIENMKNILFIDYKELEKSAQIIIKNINNLNLKKEISYNAKSLIEKYYLRSKNIQILKNFFEIN